MNELVRKAQELADTTAQKVKETTETVNQNVQHSLESLSQKAIATANSGKARVEEYQTSVTLSLSASAIALSNSLQHLPKTATELAQEMPAIARRLRTGAGLRLGDPARADAEVMKLFDKIPGTSKLNADEATIRQFLADKHGSHIQARSQGGSNDAHNIVWEVGADNIRRGANPMTASEQLYIRAHNAVDSILKNSATLGKLGIQATGTAIVTQAVVTAIAYSLDLYRGDITPKEFQDKILAAALSAGIATPIFFLIFIAVLALIPELTVILSAPTVVVGFNFLFGVSIASPLIQSILRHLEAGGFGETATQTAEQLITLSTAEIRNSLNFQPRHP
ncbi:MAG: HNH endonuclease [Desertifilum sp.]|nr:HNH endonuclease [Desertifilum sp.]